MVAFKSKCLLKNQNYLMRYMVTKGLIESFFKSYSIFSSFRFPSSFGMGPEKLLRAIDLYKLK